MNDNDTSSDVTEVIDYDVIFGEQDENKEYNIDISSPSITIGILGHGNEIYDKWLPNYHNTVRVLSKASMPFNVGVTSYIQSDTCNIEINMLILNKSVEVFEENPKKGTIYIFDKIIDSVKQTYLDMINPNIKSYEKYNPLYTDVLKRSYKEQEALTIQIPNHEKIYKIRGDEETKKKIYGIYIINVKNKPEYNLSPLEELTRGRFPEIEQELDRLNVDDLYNIYHKINSFSDTISLSEIVKLFKGLGFKYINIIDCTCRVSLDPNIQFTERSKRSYTRGEQGPFKALTQSKRYKIEGGKKIKTKTKKQRRQRKTKKHKSRYNRH
jgi:hypothetical protein